MLSSVHSTRFSFC